MANFRLKSLQQHSFAIALALSGVVALGVGWWSSTGHSFRSLLGMNSPQLIESVNLAHWVQEQGDTTLTQLWQESEQTGLAGYRGRYRFADALLARKQGAAALKVLDGLERQYPVLAAQIEVKRAQAYELVPDMTSAQATWQYIIQKYPKNPASVEAYYQLGRMKPELWDVAIATFPAAPRTLEIASQRAKDKNSPTRMADLLLIAQHGLYRDDYGTVLAQLVGQYGQKLKLQDWEAIAFGYWENQDYLRAGKAYQQTPITPRNLYRVGRGYQLGQKDDKDKQTAIQAYKTLVAKFPKAEESGLALRRLGQLVPADQQGQFLDRVVPSFPQEAPAALLQKITWAKKNRNPAQEKAAAQRLLQQYSPSEATAEYRWQMAQDRAKAGDRKAALQWAKQILDQNSTTAFAPAALFWMGKWTQALSRQPQTGKPFFEQVLQRYPTSYYAWRSASFLGKPVGDFKTVRTLQICPGLHCGVTDPPRPALPTGSEALRELYAIGQGREAWALWQTEYPSPMEPSVKDQYMDGLMRQGIGDYLNGIFMITFLDQRQKPQERSQVAALKQNPDYGYALHPLPYWDATIQFSMAHRVNPWLAIGLIRQESRFQPKIHSSAGAVGLMQVLPETADWIAPQLKIKTFDLETPNDNLRLGTWYLGYTHDQFQNNSMLAVASYNAGPGAVEGWVKSFKIQDPDEFVEAIPYDETRKYVTSVFENYWNYLRLYNPTFRQ